MYQQFNPYPQQQPQQQQQLRLPCPFDQVVIPVMRVDPMNPPFVPQVSVPAEMHQLLPAIAGTAMVEILQRAGSNYLRTFMANLMGNNGFNNREFAQLVEIAANHIALRLMNTNAGFQGHPVDVVRQLTPSLVTVMAGALVGQYTDLQQVMSPQQRHEAQQHINTMSQVAQEIQAFYQQRQGGYAGGGGYGGGGYAGGGGGYNPAQQSPAVSIGMTGAGLSLLGAPGGGGGYAAPTPVHQGGVSMTPAAARMRRQLEQNQQQQHAPLQTAAASLASYRGTAATHLSAAPAPAAEVTAQPHRPRDPAVINEVSTRSIESERQQIVQQRPIVSDVMQVSAPPVQEQVEETRDVVYYKPGEVQWKPSKLQPYHPAWNYLTHYLMYAKDHDDNVIAVLALRNPSDEQTTVNFDQHAIGRVPTTPAVHTGKPVEEVTTVRVDVEQPCITGSDVVSMEISQTNALQDGSITANLLGYLDKKNNVFRTNSIIADPLYCKTKDLADHYRDTLERISASGSFVAAQRILRGLTAENEILLFNRVNDSLTAAVTDSLRFGLALPKAKIDNFYKEVDALDKTIRTQLGQDLANTLKEREAQIIATAIGTISEAEAEHFTSQLIESTTDQELRGYLVFMTYSMSASHLAASSSDLGIAMHDTPSVVSESSHSFLYAVAKDLFGDTKLRNRRLYVITSDGIQFELARGFLGQEAYLIRRIPASSI